MSALKGSYQDQKLTGILLFTFKRKLTVLLLHFLLYLCSTPYPEKNLRYFRHNFIKYWPIFKDLSLLQTSRDLQQSGH